MAVSRADRRLEREPRVVAVFGEAGAPMRSICSSSSSSPGTTAIRRSPHPRRSSTTCCSWATAGSKVSSRPRDSRWRTGGTSRSRLPPVGTPR